MPLVVIKMGVLFLYVCHLWLYNILENVTIWEILLLLSILLLLLGAKTYSYFYYIGTKKCCKRRKCPENHRWGLESVSGRQKSVSGGQEDELTNTPKRSIVSCLSATFSSTNKNKRACLADVEQYVADELKTLPVLQQTLFKWNWQFNYNLRDQTSSGNWRTGDWGAEHWSTCSSVKELVLF